MKSTVILIISLLIGVHCAHAQWYRVNTNTTENLYDLFFVDSLEGYCVGGSDDWGAPQSKGVILKTTDGGENWTTIFSKDSLMIRNIAVVEVNGDRKLYAFGLKDGASYLVSTLINTSLQNWSLTPIVYSPTNINAYDNAIFFLDQNGGGLKRIENSILSLVLRENNPALFSISASGLLYTNGSFDSLYFSIDYGINISILPQHPTNIVGSNQISDAKIKLVGDTLILKGTYPSSVVYSLDKGNSWSYNYGGGERKSIILETTQLISIHTHSNQILTTNDFGQNWN